MDRGEAFSVDFGGVNLAAARTRAAALRRQPQPDLVDVVVAIDEVKGKFGEKIDHFDTRSVAAVDNFRDPFRPAEGYRLFGTCDLIMGI